jgi:hypothetical protein
LKLINGKSKISGGKYMKLYVVSVLSFFDNKIVSEKIEAESWKEALLKHSKMKAEDESVGEDWLSDDIEEAKFDAFNADIVFEVLEI